MNPVPISWDQKVNQHEGMEADTQGMLFRKDVAAGAAWWGKGRSADVTVENAVLRFACPCGCGCIGALAITHWDPKGWSWNGNKELPTTTPSVQMLSACRWHGYLTDGVWKPV
jgi:hypothetical protein